MQRRSLSTHAAPQHAKISQDPALNSGGSATAVDPADTRNDTVLSCWGIDGCTKWRLLAALVVFRVGSAVLSQTAFVPDEYWQSLEVAHRMVFGYGYLTWEWQESIRGYTHPLLYAGLYKVLALLHVDYALLLVELPKVVNALLAVVCDVYVLKLAGLLYGAKAGGLALLCNISSWFLFYSLPRSMANSLETVLTAPLLYHWYMSVDHALPQARRRHTAVYLSLSSVAALVRPTAVIVSAPLVLAHLYKRPRQWRMLLKYSIAIGVVALLWSLAVDWYFYEQPVFVQWNFFVFNVLEGQSAIYGTHPWHCRYITQGVPVVLSTSLPTLGLLLCLRPARSVWGLVSLGGWVVVAHSLLAHKEFRFIMPVVPIASILAGHTLSQMFSSKKTRVLGWCNCALMVVNIPVAVWFCLVHQRGTLDAMTYLRSDVDENSSVLFLMPCHSTPFYSHIHRRIAMEFLECPPQLDDSYIDVEKEFYSSPAAWLDRRYSQTHLHPPTHIVMFDTLTKDIELFLKRHRYREAARMFHTLHPLESDMGTHVVIFVMDHG